MDFAWEASLQEFRLRAYNHFFGYSSSFICNAAKPSASCTCSEPRNSIARMPPLPGRTMTNSPRKFCFITEDSMSITSDFGGKRSSVCTFTLRVNSVMTRSPLAAFGYN